jgi:uncharacterized protein (DUF983 family)
MLLRCPRCGAGGQFHHWVEMHDDCATCGMHFERVEGYWLGSVALNLGVTMGLFLVVFVGLMVITWPDVPWTSVLIVVVVITAITPIIFHPWSRTLWLAAERHAYSRSHPYE